MPEDYAIRLAKPDKQVTEFASQAIVRAEARQRARVGAAALEAAYVCGQRGATPEIPAELVELI